MNDFVDDVTTGPATSWRRPSWFSRARRSLVEELFDNDGLSAIFTHARNVLTGAAVVAAGVYAVHHVGKTDLPGMWTVHIAGYGISFFGVLLLGLNLFDGMRKLARRKHHTLMRALVMLVYLGLSIRLTQVILYFRAPL